MIKLNSCTACGADQVDIRRVLTGLWLAECPICGRTMWGETRRQVENDWNAANPKEGKPNDT